jgi:hypothetical protein
MKFGEKNALYSEIYKKHTVGKMQHSFMSRHMLHIGSTILQRVNILQFININIYDILYIIYMLRCKGV